MVEGRFLICSSAQLPGPYRTFCRTGGYRRVQERTHRCLLSASQRKFPPPVHGHTGSTCPFLKYLPKPCSGVTGHASFRYMRYAFSIERRVPGTEHRNESTSSQLGRLVMLACFCAAEVHTIPVNKKVKSQDNQQPLPRQSLSCIMPSVSDRALSSGNTLVIMFTNRIAAQPF